MTDVYIRWCRRTSFVKKAPNQILTILSVQEGERGKKYSFLHCHGRVASLVVLVVKNHPANAGDVGDSGSIPESGRSPGGGHADSLQYSCLGNAMNRGTWWVMVHGVAKSRTQLNTTRTFTFYFMEDAEPGQGRRCPNRPSVLKMKGNSLQVSVCWRFKRSSPLCFCFSTLFGASERWAFPWSKCRGGRELGIYSCGGGRWEAAKNLVPFHLQLHLLCPRIPRGKQTV